MSQYALVILLSALSMMSCIDSFADGAQTDAQPIRLAGARWLVVRYMGPTKESLSATVLYVGDAGLRQVTQYLTHAPLRKTAISAAEMKRVTDYFLREKFIAQSGSPERYDHTHPCHFTFGGTIKTHVIALGKPGARRVLQALEKDALKDSEGIRLIKEYAPMFD